MAKRPLSRGRVAAALAPPSARNAPRRPMSPNLVPRPITVSSAVAGAPNTDDETELSEDDRKLLKAKRQYRSVCEAESILRKDMFDDRRFRLAKLGDEIFQWPEGIAAERKADRRPLLQVNRVAGFVEMAKNQGDMANLRITYNPVGDDGDAKVAEVLAGLARNVETRSFATEDAYSTAGDAQAEMGRGYMWLLTAFESDDSFRQVAWLKRVLNPFRVKVDRSAQEKDQSDAEFSFYDTDLDEDTWKELHGTDENGEERELPTADRALWGDVGDATGDWFPSGNKIRVTHWFCAEYERDTLYELRTALPNGKTEVREAALKEEVERLMLVAHSRNKTRFHPKRDPKELAKAIAKFKKLQVKQSRPLKVRTIKWRIIDACYILAETDWPTPWQPLIPMVGAESDLDGQYDCRGVTRNMKDPQRVYNVMTSSKAETANDAPKMPFIGWRGQFGKKNTAQNNAWKNHTLTKLAYLEADPPAVDLDGKVAVTLPTRNYGTVDLAGYNESILQADNDMKSTAQIHDASLGEGPVGPSGKAQQERKQQDQVANSYLMLNRRRAIASCGRQLVRIFRTIYDVATVVRITGGDDQKRKIMVFTGPENDPRNDPNFKLPDGVQDKDIHDIGVGEYDVEITAAPHPGSRRQEDLSMVGDMLKILPPQYSVNFMDLFFKLLDTSTGRAMSQRADKMLDPKLRDHEEGGPQQQMVPMEAVQQHVGQMQQQIQKLVEQLKTRVAEKRAEKQEEMKGKLAIERMKIDATGQNAAADRETRLAIAELTAKVDRIQLFMDERARLGIQGHDAVMAAAQNAHDLGTTMLEHFHNLQAIRAQGDLSAQQQQAQHAHETEQQQAAAAAAAAAEPPADGGASA